MLHQTTPAQANRSAATSIERRAAVRYACDLDSSCRRITTGEKDFWGAKILNISAMGIGLLIGRRFELGTLLGIELQGARDNSLHQVMVRVANVRSEGARQWILGCAFTTPLTDEEVEALL